VYGLDPGFGSGSSADFAFAAIRAFSASVRSLKLMGNAILRSRNVWISDLFYPLFKRTSHVVSQAGKW